MSGVVVNRQGKRRVLVTRPQPDAAYTVTRLAAAGYVPLCLPVSKTTATDISLPLRKFDAVAVTSANAFRHTKPALLAPYRHLQLYAVGEKTASVAREAGFDKVYAGDGWGLHLGQYVAATESAGNEILYLTGKIRRPDFESQLAEAGIHLTVAETYDTLAVAYNEAELAEILRDGPPEVILLYSAVAARQFVRLDNQVNGAFIKGAKFIFCLSQRIAAELPAGCITQLRISETPDEDALLRLLELC